MVTSTGGSELKKAGRKPISAADSAFHPSVIQTAVRLTYRFRLSHRDVEELLAGRGIDVSFETVRRWRLKFGPLYARRMRRKRSRPFSVWHIDEVFLKIAGQQHYLWRAVDAEGEVLDVLLQSRRNKAAAVRFIRKSMRRTDSVPTTVVTDKWRPTMAAARIALPSAEHVFGKRLSNRAENSHQPTRRRERKLQRFKPAKSAQRFLSTHVAFYNHFNIQRHLISRRSMKQFRAQSLGAWAKLVA